MPGIVQKINVCAGSNGTVYHNSLVGNGSLPYHSFNESSVSNSGFWSKITEALEQNPQFAQHHKPIVLFPAARRSFPVVCHFSLPTSATIFHSRCLLSEARNYSNNHKLVTFALSNRSVQFHL